MLAAMPGRANVSGGDHMPKTKKATPTSDKSAWRFTCQGGPVTIGTGERAHASAWVAHLNAHRAVNHFGFEEVADFDFTRPHFDLEAALKEASKVKAQNARDFRTLLQFGNSQV